MPNVVPLPARTTETGTLYTVGSHITRHGHIPTSLSHLMWHCWYFAGAGGTYHCIFPFHVPLWFSGWAKPLKYHRISKVTDQVVSCCFCKCSLRYRPPAFSSPQLLNDTIVKAKGRGWAFPYQLTTMWPLCSQVPSHGRWPVLHR